MAGRVTPAIAIGLAFNDSSSAGLLITQPSNQPHKATKEMGLMPHFFLHIRTPIACDVHVIDQHGLLDRLAVNRRMAAFG
jgi:hypothetical protein